MEKLQKRGDDLTNKKCEYTKNAAQLTEHVRRTFKLVDDFLKDPDCKHLRVRLQGPPFDDAKTKALLDLREPDHRHLPGVLESKPPVFVGAHGHCLWDYVHGEKDWIAAWEETCPQCPVDPPKSASLQLRRAVERQVHSLVKEHGERVRVGNVSCAEKDELVVCAVKLAGAGAPLAPPCIGLVTAPAATGHFGTEAELRTPTLEVHYHD